MLTKEHDVWMACARDDRDCFLSQCIDVLVREMASPF
jgi:hypothetical protein